jgi:beta-glucosidase
LADAGPEMIGPWSGAGRGDEAVSVYEGLRAGLPNAAIDLVAGMSIDGGATDGVSAVVEAAQKAEHVILCLGEAAPMSGEAASRATLALPGHQLELAEAVFAIGKPTIVLLFSGRPIAMPEIFARAAAVVACWFPGSEAGHAVSDLLRGRINPSAHLSVTWPRHVGQVPIAFSALPSGRPEVPGNKYTSKYLDMPNSPQFPFGHGLSYTHFSLSDPRITPGTSIVVETDVRNDGDRPGATPVFLFTRDPVASVSRPVLELKRFERVELEPGDRRTLTFTLERDDLAFLGVDLQPIVEPGEILVHVGFSADRMKLRTGRFELV